VAKFKLAHQAMAQAPAPQTIGNIVPLKVKAKRKVATPGLVAAATGTDNIEGHFEEF